MEHGPPASRVAPSRGRRILYYTLGLTPPAETRAWVEADLDTIAWRIRRGMQMFTGTLVGLLIGGWGLALISDVVWARTGPWILIGGLIGGTLGAVLQATVMAPSIRRNCLAQYRKRWTRQLERSEN